MCKKKSMNKKTSFESSNLTPQRYTLSWFDKGTNSIAYTIVMNEIAGSMLFDAYRARAIKLAS